LQWHPIASKHLFYEARIGYWHSLKALLKLNQKQVSNRLIRSGMFIRKVKMMYCICIPDEKGEVLPYRDFEKLVKCCPNVDTLHLSSFLFLNCMVAHLFKMDDDIKWKLRNLNTICDDNAVLKLHINSDDSVELITKRHDVDTVQFFRKYPALQYVKLSSPLHIKAMRDFVRIFDVSPNLSKLDIVIETKELAQFVMNEKKHPSLKTLDITVPTSLIPKQLLDYFTKGFNCLSRIHIYINQIEEFTNFTEVYNGLLNFLVTRPENSFFQLTFNRRMQQVDNMISECISNTFGLQLMESNVYNSIKIFKRPNTTKRMAITASLKKLPNDTVVRELALQIADRGGRLFSQQNIDRMPPNIHKLYINLKNQSTHLSRDICLFIQKCQELWELTFWSGCLYTFHDLVYESIKVIRVYGSEFDPNFLRKLSINCPNLEELYLQCIDILIEGDSDEIFDAANDDGAEVNLVDMSLQKLSLDTRVIKPYERNWKQELVYVTTHKGRTNILIENISKLTILATEKAVEVKRHMKPLVQYNIRCHDIARFEINDIEVHLVQ
jgi:hypothetical protein